ncbi:RagB/SusD family nutrient uptake outer membrane protein [Hymenobacter busanensis]|uniref:RagB/SusD family nutrient uptake outer membrane protein n=1 Tax=Hymenobacter busanensis TaxID=2607656 RepID=A0A7L4ZUS0_9BACT|nr:RagB/SusD family nutrient uptake outer membrane protein [Hymenobacter busanensis]KAA9339486.1 RagB/SusD family nutrient uptake outer membrane protein [Hymenobacter busanensis]QHJ06757.1 RagB/SusD family nutrient uptake outer membrane protein [Hymenobacter busanensis]
MHKIIRPLTFALLVLAASACKDQLEEFNPSGATAEAVFTTPEGFETAVNGAYTYNRAIYGKESGYALLEMGTDIWTNAQLNGETQASNVRPQPPLMNYQGLNTDNVWVKNNLWVPCYQGINLVNQALKFINQAGLSATRRPSAEAELRFLRAWYYYHLVESYGPVPLRLEPTEGVVTTATRASVQEVYTQILADVDFAVRNLPVTLAQFPAPATGTDYGRITRPAAEAFAAKAYLSNGQYQKAANYARKVTTGYTGQGIRLLTNYADLWTFTNQRNAEVLWAVNYSTNLAFNAGSHTGHQWFLMQYDDLPGMAQDVANGRPQVRYMPTRFLLDLYNEQNDARYLGSFKQAWIANNATVKPIPRWTQAEVNQNPALAPFLNQPKFAVGDTAVFTSKRSIPDFEQLYTRRYRYKTYDIDDLYNADGSLKGERRYYPSLRKFDDPTRATPTTSESSRDANMLRLGDIVLIGAEAQVRLGRTDSAAYYVNLVRTRAALPGRTAAMQVTPAQMTLDFILDERARELAGEQVRWLDLKRTGKLVERVRAHNPDARASIQDFHRLRPIPQSDIDVVTNKGEFYQNDGYN